MKINYVLGGLAMAVVLALGGEAVAQEKFASPVIAIVDVQLLMRESVAAKKVLEQASKYSAAYQQEFSPEEAKIREAEKELAGQANLVSAEAFKEKRAAFETRANEFVHRVQLRRQSLDQATSKAMGQVVSAVNKLVSDVAGQVGANLVLQRTQVEFFDSKLDITKPVLERLNATVKEVKFPDPVKDIQAKAGNKGAPAPAAAPAKK
jgi:Skp family chaperone for outer membrane proteins